MIPEGMRDVIPPEAAQLRALEASLCRCFEAFGYGEVRTPWLEYVETMEAVGDDTLAAGYRLRDQRGHELMVRTDMTVPVARLAAARFDAESLPLRLSYVAPSIRPWTPSRSQDGEFLQAGAELIGASSPAADAESITLLCDCLTQAGLTGFKVVIGSIEFYTGFVDSLGFKPDDRRAFLDALAERDYPLLESIASKAGVAPSSLNALWRTLKLTAAHDGLQRARKLATNSTMTGAIDRLDEVYDLVEQAGFADHVVFDFGLFQDLTFYTGIFFEVYARGVGLPIASGGRFDGLLRSFGWEVPGVGFAVAVERLYEALEEIGAAPAAPSAPLSFVGGLGDVERAMELRRAGWSVVALPSDSSTSSRPLLTRHRSSYALELADGRTANGSWREVLRLLEMP